MSTYLWSVIAKKNWGTVLKGMSVDVIVNNNSGKPSIDKIKEALQIKYNIKIAGGMPSDTFDFQKV